MFCYLMDDKCNSDRILKIIQPRKEKKLFENKLKIKNLLVKH